MEELPRFQEALEPLGFALHSRRPENPLLIVDSFGRVPEFLGCCHAAVIGGSFAPRGGHNLWEPLAAGVSMIIGPHHWNQAYLVHRLFSAGLLRIANNPLSPVTLKKSETDPGLICRNFIAAESYILQQAVEQIRAGLGTIAGR
jgi:3-deoxy-D-manno-octulosonic-acid transferase